MAVAAGSEELVLGPGPGPVLLPETEPLAVAVRELAGFAGSAGFVEMVGTVVVALIAQLFASEYFESAEPGSSRPIIG